MTTLPIGGLLHGLLLTVLVEVMAGSAAIMPLALATQPAESVTVTDSAGCVASASGIIAAEPAITSTSTVNSNPCSNPPMGNVVITPASGLGPLVYTLLPTGPSNNTGIFDSLS